MDKITVQATIDAPVEKVWEFYNTPDHVVQWNNASPDWHTPKAQNDLKIGGKFIYRMEARDGSAGFDFEGVYDEIIDNTLIKYSMSDGREVEIKMSEVDGKTFVEIIFDPESENEPEFQRAGWQAILDNFKSYVEGNI